MCGQGEQYVYKWVEMGMEVSTSRRCHDRGFSSVRSGSSYSCDVQDLHSCADGRTRTVFSVRRDSRSVCFVDGRCGSNRTRWSRHSGSRTLGGCARELWIHYCFGRKSRYCNCRDLQEEPERGSRAGETTRLSSHQRKPRCQVMRHWTCCSAR